MGWYWPGAAPTVAAGRAGVLARLRALATRLERLPLDTAADVLVLVEPGTPEKVACHPKSSTRFLATPLLGKT
jgi:hypothetical protein